MATGKGILEIIVTDAQGKDVVIPVGEVEITQGPLSIPETPDYLTDNTQWSTGNQQATMQYYDVKALQQWWEYMGHAVRAVEEASITFELLGKQVTDFWRAISRYLGVYINKPRSPGERRYKRRMARQRGLPWEHIKC